MEQASGQGSRLDAKEKLRLLSRKAKQARTSLSDFFEFTMRSESTHERMRVAPHQQVLFDFVQHPPHPRCAVVLPIGHGKTFSMTAYGLYQLTQNTNHRGMVISCTQTQAKNTVNLMRQIIEREPRLRVVNPRMRPSRSKGDPWSDTAFTIEREFGAKDPSFMAVGLDSHSITGKRLDFCLADDLLNLENTGTPEQMNKLLQFVDYILKNRMEPGGRLVFCNTIFNPDDLMAKFMKTRDRGGLQWPTIRMSAKGDIWTHNADPDWRPLDERGRSRLVHASDVACHYRLMAYEPDPENEQTLWPARVSAAQLEEKRVESAHNPGSFNRTMLSDVYDDSTAMCKQSFIDLCCEQARKVGYFQTSGTTEDFVGFYGPGWRPGGKYGPGAGENYRTITGLDLAMKVGQENDLTAFFTFECDRPDGFFRILDIDFGHWPVDVIARKAVDKALRYNSPLVVESQGGGDFLKTTIQNLRGTPRKDGGYELDRNIPVYVLTTSATSKEDPVYGVAQIFYEMSRGMWLFPNKAGEPVRMEMAQFVEDCRTYHPSKHTSDLLMASHMGRRQAVKWGWMRRPDGSGRGGGLGSLLMR